MVAWGLCFLLFWYLEFGSVFMLGTGFALIFANLGDTRREGDMSAWVSQSCASFVDLVLTGYVYRPMTVLLCCLTECVQSRIYDYVRNVISRTNGS